MLYESKFMFSMLFPHILDIVYYNTGPHPSQWFLIKFIVRLDDSRNSRVNIFQHPLSLGSTLSGSLAVTQTFQGASCLRAFALAVYFVWVTLYLLFIFSFCSGLFQTPAPPCTLETLSLSPLSPLYSSSYSSLLLDTEIVMQPHVQCLSPHHHSLERGFWSVCIPGTQNST